MHIARSLTLFHMRRTKSEWGIPLRTLSPIAPDKSASTSGAVVTELETDAYSPSLKGLSRQLSGTMFAMTSSETSCTSRRSLTLFPVCRTRPESGISLRTLSPIAPDRSATTLAPSPPSLRRTLTSSEFHPAAIQTLRSPWTGSPAPVGRAARSTDLSGTHPRRTTSLLLPPGDQEVSQAST